MKKQFFVLLIAGCMAFSALKSTVAEQGLAANTNTSANIVANNANKDEKVADAEDFSVPIISIRTKGPAAIESDRTASYNVKVRNVSTKKDASVKVVINFPKECGFMDANPSPQFIKEGSIEYSIPNLTRMTEQDLNITLTPPKTGNLDLKVVCSLEADNNVETVVKRPLIQYDIDGPPTGAVNVPIPMQISLKNTGKGIVRSVMISSELPKGVVLDERTSEQLANPFDIKGGETKKLKFNVTAIDEGRHNLHFRLEAGNMSGKIIQTRVNAIRPSLDIHLVGPAQHVAGQRGDYTLVIENNSSQMIEEAELDLEIPGTLLVEKVSRYGDYFRDEYDATHMVWPILKVKPGQRISIRLRAKALAEYRAKCNMQLRFSDGFEKNYSYTVGAAKDDGKSYDSASMPIELTEVAELPSEKESTTGG